jgi:hypothetical protein
MYSPNVNKAEGIRLINEIAKSDLWICITANTEDKEIFIHTEDQEEGLALLTSYVVHNEKLRNRIIDTIKIMGYEI